MPMLLCCTCDRQFDTDIQVEAEYFPIPKCEDCVYAELEKQLQETWLQLDQDEEAIKDFCEDKL